MAILLSCNQCDKKFRFSDEKEGRFFRCSQCGHQQKITAGQRKADSPDGWELENVELADYEEKDKTPREKRRKRIKRKQTAFSTSNLIVRGIGGMLLLFAVCWFYGVWQYADGMDRLDRGQTIAVNGAAPSMFVALIGVVMLIYGEEPNEKLRAANRLQGIKTMIVGVLMLLGVAVLLTFLVFTDFKPAVNTFKIPGVGLAVIGLATTFWGLISIVTGRNLKGG